jgi:uncharacterized protein (TIGR00290 family)
LTGETGATWLWWSSGKDSAFALQKLRERADTEVTALVTTVNASFDRVAMHAVRTELLRRQAEAAGVPLRVVEIPHPCSNAEYEAAAGREIAEARRSGVRRMAFGDLFLEDVRRYREDLLAGTGIEPIFPLWGMDTAALAQTMLASGLRAVVTCIDPRALSADFAGRRFDSAFLDALPESADPCGERGEFHTFACAGPMFASEIDVRVGDIVERDGFVFADVLPNG